MAITIQNPEAERLAHEVVELTGETKADAVTQALRERLQRLRREKTGRTLSEQLDEIALHCSGLPVLDPRPADEILGDDEDAAPG